MADIKSIPQLIEKAVALKDARLMARAIRQIMTVRKKLKASIITSYLKHALPAGSDPQIQLVAYLSALPGESDTSMVVDSTPSSTASKSPPLPEVEAFMYLLVLIFLIDQKAYQQAKECSSAAVRRLQQFNRRTLDQLAARIFFYFSLSYEKTGSLVEIRSVLLGLHRTATLRHDEIGQEVLLNLLLRNYLHYNLYEQAEKLRSKAQRPESHSNQQYCRYVFYLGRILTIQLEYTDAKEYLQQALRKAPQVARGFRIACTKWSAIVRLLLGEIPERTTFMQPDMKSALVPYFELTNAVRIGDLDLFKRVAEKHWVVFQADKTHNLIIRLRHNVIRTGLRRINVSYSRISLADVAAKLHLGGASAVDDAECIVTKAIRDGGIDATVDHANGYMSSKETGDVYSTQEPQQAFHVRIAFCLNTHNEAVKAMSFPPNVHQNDLETPEKRRERQQQEQELAKQISDEDDDEF
eukprot:TRINITY_DN11652_c0_g2_i1.p1 TRINITY_DN11652_c0_g2~~TRINITY_DN11652_c0_g2_i1.p1  ORF type:complete len:467 (+),score=77.92 TRINITY_DN11652_c0_g2_i1:189-1589(+)